MAGLRRYQDLKAWQLCMELADVIVEITEDGPASRNLDYQDQVRRAAEAAAPLIAEGFVRFTPAELVRYLRMTRAEIAEVQTNLERGRRRKYFTEEQLARAQPLADHAMAVTTNFLKSKLPLLKKNKRPARSASRPGR